MNKYINETANSVGGSKKKIKGPGKQTLNGVQAVTYARIRKDAATGDYRRNERMKIVVKKAFEKAKHMDYSALKKITKNVMPEMKTNMSTADIMGMMMKLNSFDMTSSSTGWPYDVGSWTGDAWYGPPVTLSSNVTKLHEDFFNQQGYTPTQHVQDISAQISAKTGLY
jgi:anionic cell wall polymer biosynthesis LytR-Cps2A-Psr (LCP) family protein